MIVERRRYVRKSYQNYTGTPVKSGGINHSSANNNAEKANNFRKITYFPVSFVSSPSDWEDDSILTTETTPSYIIYAFAILTALAFFAIGYSFFAG